MKSFLPLLLLPLCLQAQEVGFPFFAADEAASAAMSCYPSNMFLQILSNGSSSLSGSDGDFDCQKIKNDSIVPITIKRITIWGQTNDASGPPVWQGWVQSSPTFGIGVYGSGSITTNLLREGQYEDFFWAPGTEPVIPALTDFYVGSKITYKVGQTANSCSQRYWGPHTGGTGYVDTNYIAYRNGSPFNGTLTHDFPLEIYACFTRPTCVTSNLWSSPINQQQLLHGNYNNMAVISVGGNRIHNTSSSQVLIKKIRLYMESQGTGAVSMRAIACSGGELFFGQMYGGLSQTISIPNGFSNFQDYVWDDGMEPIIPPNTDFYIGAYPFASNLVMIQWQNANVYETTAYAYILGGFVTTGGDAAFEVYICD